MLYKVSDTSIFKFRYASGFDKILAVVGALFAVVTGVAQPAAMMIGGKLNNVLLTVDPKDPRFRRESFQCIYMYLGFGIICFLMNYIQVSFPYYKFLHS